MAGLFYRNIFAPSTQSQMPSYRNIPRAMDASSYGSSLHTDEWTLASADRGRTESSTAHSELLAIVIYKKDGCHIIVGSSPAGSPWHEMYRDSPGTPQLSFGVCSSFGAYNIQPSCPTTSLPGTDHKEPSPHRRLRGVRALPVLDIKMRCKVHHHSNSVAECIRTPEDMRPNIDSVASSRPQK